MQNCILWSRHQILHRYVGVRLAGPAIARVMATVAGYRPISFELSHLSLFVVVMDANTLLLLVDVMII